MSTPVPEFKLKSEVIMNAITMYLFRPIFDTQFLGSPCTDPLVIGAGAKNVNTLYCSALSYLYSFDVVNRNHQNDTSAYPVYPIMDVQGISELKILSYIKGNVSKLSGNFNYNDIAFAIATGTNAASDNEMLRDLELDMYSAPLSPLQLKNTIVQDLTGNDAPSIATSLYNLMSFPYASSTKGEIELSDAIENAGNLLTTVAAINNAVSSLTGDFTYYDIINAFINAIQAANNQDLVDDFTLDFISQAIGGINGATYTPQQLQAMLANINGNSAPSVASYIYNALEKTWATSVAGALSLNENIGYEHDINNVEYPIILANIISNVSSLNGDFTNNDIAQAIVTGISSVDNNLLTHLKIDIDASIKAANLTPLQIQTNIINIILIPNSQAEITASIYGALTWGAGTLGIDAQDLLTYAIDDYIISGGVNVTSSLNASVALLNTETAPLNDISLAIAYTIKAQSNVSLINLLEVSVINANFSVTAMQNALSNIAIIADDAALIATNIFSAMQFPYLSTNQGLVGLMKNIQLYDRSDNELVFPAAVDGLRVAVGEQYLNLLTPYYNYCTKLDDTNFNVTGTIIDAPINGTVHSVYDAIKDTALLLYNDGIPVPVLYITTSSPIGTIGNESYTSCSNGRSLSEIVLLTDFLLELSVFGMAP